ncbi:hypothetical protein RJ640_021522 [Escallonia rubra]|uniref:Inositol-phosphate phosphatase n=1 Tax=Escallonia rubra TaxID=112253 RepID=A0AA88QBQ6_9ASTE|nr:hypothetical protein RJ640_021522 [Escallonia rubra]
METVDEAGTDKMSEAAILEVVRKNFGDHLILGEEGGLIGDSSSDYLWCIDPLDGTTNFAHGYPSFAVSVGVLFRGKPAAAAVVEFVGGPMCWNSRIFSAASGKKMFLAFKVQTFWLVTEAYYCALTVEKHQFRGGYCAGIKLARFVSEANRGAQDVKVQGRDVVETNLELRVQLINAKGGRGIGRRHGVESSKPKPPMLENPSWGGAELNLNSLLFLFLQKVP